MIRMTRLHPVRVAILLSLAGPLAVVAQGIPGTGELCIEVSREDSIGSQVDSLHVVMQQTAGFDEESSPRFEVQGLKSVPGIRPTPDSLMLLLTVEGGDLFVIRTRSHGDGYLGAAGYPELWDEAQAVRLNPIRCPR